MTWSLGESKTTLVLIVSDTSVEDRRGGTIAIRRNVECRGRQHILGSAALDTISKQLRGERLA
jgi:hypothetical protein